MPFPIVISGPSGVGKNALVDDLMRADPLLRHSISVTTRPPREGEIEGRDYFFVDEAVFESKKEAEFVEWAEVHDYLYGTPRRFVEQELSKGHDVVLNIDVQGGLNVKKAFPSCVLIFILPPSSRELEKRIRGRGTDTEDEIRKRLENARKEIEASGKYEYYVINDTVSEGVARLKAIVEAERCRKERYSGRIVS